MYIQGKITNIYDVQTGESPKGTWKKKEFVVETNSKFPKKICLILRGDMVDNFRYQIGDMVQVSIDIESRQSNDRWYTEVRAWKFDTFTNRNSENEPSNYSSDEEMM